MLPVFFPIINIGLMIFDRDLFRSMMATTYDGMRTLFLILIIIEITKRDFRMPKFGLIYISIGALSLFMLIHAIVHHPDFFEVWPKTSQVITLTLPLLFFTMRRDLLPKLDSLIKAVGFMIILQILGLVVQSYGLHIYPTFYVPTVTILENGMMYDDSVYEGMMRGTFPSANVFSNFVVLLFLFLSLEYFSNKVISSFYYYFICLLLGGMIALSGIRVSMLMFILIFVICNLIYIKRHFTVFVITSSVAIFVFLFLLSFDVDRSNSFTDSEGINRQIEGIASVVQSKKEKDDDHSTFRLTPYLLENYFIDGFLIGNGRENKGEFAYGSSGTVSLEGFHNDALLAYILVEYGIIGAFIYFFYFNSVFNFLKSHVAKSERKKLTVCFVIYTLLTIVDPGLFDRYNFTMVYFYTLCVLSRNTKANFVMLNKKRCIHIQL